MASTDNRFSTEQLVKFAEEVVEARRRVVKPHIFEVPYGKVEEDVVNNPSHYSVLGDVEAIHLIRLSMSEEEWRGYCLGNIMKYRLRAGEKDALEQDIAKANKYKELYEELL